MVPTPTKKKKWWYSYSSGMVGKGNCINMEDQNQMTKRLTYMYIEVILRMHWILILKQLVERIYKI